MPSDAQSRPTSSGPRLLLFGRPGAGKSSLLTALARVTAQPSPMLKGRLIDDSGKLATLAATKGDSGAEVVAYPVHLEPDEPGGTSWSATLLDTSGAADQEYLAGRKRIGAGGLGQALLETDTLILVVDAAAGAQTLEADFEAFGKFLHLLEEVRGQRVDVAGLPVYLVLTKCDLLARTGDSFVRWMQRIEEGKRRVGERFREFLASAADPYTFGEVELRLWATAAQRPALADRAARAEPYGVVELFRQCLVSAEDYRARRDRAGQKLSTTVAATTGLLALLGLVAALLYVFQPSHELTTLEDQARVLLPAPGATASVRLRGTPEALRGRLTQLRTIEGDKDFARLPADLRRDVERTSREIDQYLAALDRFQKEIKPPYLAKNEDELKQYERQLSGFRLPEDYVKEWGTTRLAVRLQGVLRQYARLHEVVDEEVGWIRGQIKDGETLLQRGTTIYNRLLTGDKAARTDAETWRAAMQQYLRRPERKESSKELPGVARMYHGDLDRFEQIRAARRAWQSVKQELLRVEDNISTRLNKAA